MINHALSMFIALNIAPFSAQYLGVYNDETAEKQGVIECQEYAETTTDECLYKVGVFSDIHLGGEVKLSVGNFSNALDYVTHKEGVEFSVLSGDISVNYNVTALELARFLPVVTSIEGAVVYSTTGNHDCPDGNSSAVINISQFKEKTAITEFFTEEATNSYEVTKIHTTGNGKRVVDHYLFLGMKNSHSSGGILSSPFLDYDLAWLERKLNEYQKDRCFIITHVFFPNGAGNLKGRYNWLNLGGTQLNRLLWMRYNHPKTFWLSGHSHWDLRYQEIERTANIYPIYNVGRAEGWTIHDASCSRVRWYKPDGTNNQYEDASQGSVMYVYPNHVDIKGIVFREHDQGYSTNAIPIATYRLPNDPEGPPATKTFFVTSNMLHAVTGKTFPPVTVNDQTHDLTVSFTGDGESVLIYNDDGTRKNAQVRVYYDYAEWYPHAPVGATAEEIGFFLDGMRAAEDPDYKVESGILVDTSAQGVQIRTSTDYTSSGGDAITLTLRNFRYTVIGEQL